MIFKCEKVDENLRKKIIETEGSYYGLKEATHWWVNDTRDIIAWKVSPHPMQIRDGDFSVDFFIRFSNKDGAIVDMFSVEFGNRIYDESTGHMTYVWKEIVGHTSNLPLEYTLPIFKDLLTSYGGGFENQDKYPNFSVKLYF